MNWIKILGIGKYILLAIFFIIIAIKRFHLIENSDMMKRIWIFDLSSLTLMLYFLVYLLQRWLLHKTKNKEIKNFTSD